MRRPIRPSGWSRGWNLCHCGCVSHVHGRTLAVFVCFSGALLASSGPAGAQTPPPCPPGVAATPTFKATDHDDGDQATNLTATHAIAVGAGFSDSQLSVDDTTAKWTGPPGVPVFAHRELNVDLGDAGVGSIAGFIPKAAGPLPVSVTWQQSDGTRGGRCSASASATFPILAAKRLRPSLPRGTASRTAHDDSEYTWFTNVRRDSDRTPVVVRLRSVRGARLPGPRVRFKSFTLSLRETDRAFGARRSVSWPFVGATATYEGGGIGFVNLRVGIGRVTSNPRLGYELELRQGTRRLGRIRAAGRCSAFGCDFSTFRVQR
jgi:hypothetical protein